MTTASSFRSATVTVLSAGLGPLWWWLVRRTCPVPFRDCRADRPITITPDPLGSYPSHDGRAAAAHPSRLVATLDRSPHSPACRRRVRRGDPTCAATRGKWSAREPGPRRLDVHPVQPKKILAEDLSLGLLAERGVAVAVHEVLRDLEVPEGLERPLWLPYRRLAAVDDLVLAAPEEQLAQQLGE